MDDAELLDTDEEDFAELLLDFAELLLDFGVTLDEDFAELLDTLVSLLLDCGVTLDEDFAELLLASSPPQPYSPEQTLRIGPILS